MAFLQENTHTNTHISTSVPQFHCDAVNKNMNNNNKKNLCQQVEDDLSSNNEPLTEQDVEVGTCHKLGQLDTREGKHGGN